MALCCSYCIAPAARVLRSRPFRHFAAALLVLAAAPRVLAGGADVSTDNLYSDDVTITMFDGSPFDINGDGFIDLIVGSNSGTEEEASRYYLGNGDGTFDPTPVLLDNRPTSEVVAADLDGDTFVDIVQGVRDLPSRIFLGDGAGGVGNPINILERESLPGEGYRVLAVAVGDLDLDGDLDLVTGTGQKGGEPGTEPLQENRYYLNNSTPGSPSFAGFDISADTDDSRSIALADLDGDGDLDVIVGNDETTTGSNRVYLNQVSGGGGMSFAAAIDFGPPDDQTSKILVDDLNGDDLPDIVVLNFIEPGFSPGINRFFLNETVAGGFALSDSIDISADADNSTGGTLADFDGDGDLDIAVSNLTTGGGNPRNRLYLNQLVESGTVGFIGSDISADEFHTRELAAGDLDGDDDIDLISGNQPIAGVSGVDRRYLNNGTADPFTNVAPVITAQPDPLETGVDTGLTVELDNLTVTDPDNAFPADFSLSVQDGESYTVEGTTVTPDAGFIGDLTVPVVVSDGTDDSEPFELTVTVLESGAPNEPPEFTSTPPTGATEGVSYTYEITASDANAGDTLAITAPTLPAWLTLTDNGDGTATLTGTPAAADVGDHPVSLAVSDGTDTTAQDFTISVAAAGENEAPEFTSTPVEAATEGESYTYEVTASDADDDALTITASDLPRWLTLEDAGDGTATLSGTPGEGDTGEHAITLEVSDGSDNAVQEFTLTVEAANDPDPPGGGGGNDDGGGGGALGWASLLALAGLALRARGTSRVRPAR